MAISIEKGKDGNGVQNIRAVVDLISNCNLGCHYCHPNFGWTGETLSPDQVGNIFQTAEDRGIFEITLTGGEITMHPNIDRILESTHMLVNTSVTCVTNATKITNNLISKIRSSNLGRICVSVDGPNAETHNRRRGNNFDAVMKGLHHLQETEKRITVISVAHRDNYARLLELSEILATESLAEEHHMCAPSFSGRAKEEYSTFNLQEAQYHELQAMIDANFEEYKRKGLHLTFNSYWPATGERGKSHAARTMTLVQFTEQVKNIYMIVRTNGDVRLTSAAWGRETIGDAVIGNINTDDVGTLFDQVDEIYRSDHIRQLPRAIEAEHKFHVGPPSINKVDTIELLAKQDASAENMVQWQPVRSLAEIDLLQNALDEFSLNELAARIAAKPKQWRVAHHASGVDVVYDRTTSHMTVLKPEETIKLSQLYDKYIPDSNSHE